DELRGHIADVLDLLLNGERALAALLGRTRGVPSKQVLRAALEVARELRREILELVIEAAEEIADRDSDLDEVRDEIANLYAETARLKTEAQARAFLAAASLQTMENINECVQ